MKKRILSILLAVTMLFQAFAVCGVAAETDGFVDFPDDWSTEAMTAAVGNGLMVGTSPTTIEPDKYVTRAEFAAAIVRAFGATVKKDISSFTDVEKSDWYYDYVAKICHMGIMEGTSKTTFSPKETMRREDVFLVLARALFISGEDETYLNIFEDKALIDSWSKNAIIGMVANEYLRGYEDNTLRPRNTITRAELAQILHNIFRTYVSEPGEYTQVSADGSVIIRSKDVVLKNVKINGDLILADGIGLGDITLENVEIAGRLIVRGAEGGTVDLVDVKVHGNVIVNNVNGTVHFHNYETEHPFEGNIIENTPATFLEPEKPSKPSGGGGGGGVVMKTLYMYADDTNSDAVTDAAKLYKASTYRITAGDIPAVGAGKTFIGWAPEKDSLEATFKQNDFFVNQTMTAVVGSALNEDFYAIYRYKVTFNKADSTQAVVYANSYNKITGAPAMADNQTGWSTSNAADNTAIDLTKDIQDLVAAAGATELVLYPVYAPAISVTGVTLNKTTLELTVGADETLTATVLPANATNKNVTWASDNNAVATVDANGKVTAVGAGTATITVTTEDGGHTATCTVTVTDAVVPVTGVELDKETVALEVGNTDTLTATVFPANATNKNVTWTSSDETVATVANGVVTAIGAGTAIITVTTEDGGYTDTCTVTVTAPTTNITIYFYKDDNTTVARRKVGAPDTIVGAFSITVEDYEFLGWSSTQNSATVEYTADALNSLTYEAVAGTATEVHLYPVLVPEGTTTYTVVFHDQTGVVIDTVSNLTLASKITTVPTVTVDADKVFSGWATTPGKTEPGLGSNAIKANTLQTVYTILGVATTNTTLNLYPVVLDESDAPKVYTVYFYNVDGNEIYKFEGYAEDPLGTVADAIHPDGDEYTFLGWYIDDPEVLVDSGYFADKTFEDVVPANETEVSYYASFDDPYMYSYTVNHYFEKWNDDLGGFEFVADEELAETYDKQLAGATVTAQALADADIPEGFEYDEFNADEVSEGVVATDNSLELKFYYTAKTYTLRYHNVPFDIDEEVADVKFGTPVIEITAANGYNLWREVGYGKDYDDMYVDNLLDKAGYESIDGTDFTYNHKIDYNWYIKDDSSEYGYTYCPTVPHDDDGDGYIDVYEKIRNIRLTIYAKDLVNTNIPLIINIPYDEETRMIDTVRDIFALNKFVFEDYFNMVDIDTKLAEQLAGFKLLEETTGGEYEFINVNDKMMYFYDMMGGKTKFENWLWDFVEDDMRPLLDAAEQAGFDVKNCNPEDLPADAKKMYYASEKFIYQATHEDSFEVTADNDFIMEYVENKVSEYTSVDSILGSRIPDKILTDDLKQIIADIYEPRVQEFLTSLADARAAVAGTTNAVAVDSGIVFKVNIVEDLIKPVYDYVNTIYDKAMDKAQNSDNRAAKLFSELYFGNPYIQGDTAKGINALVSFTDPDLLFKKVANRDNSEPTGGYQLEALGDIINNVISPFTVQLGDAMLWFTDEDACGRSFADDIRPVLEENSELIIEVNNHLNSLSEKYAKYGLPDSFEEYYDDLVSNDVVADAIHKLENGTSFDMMTYVETAIQNNAANNMLRKMLSKFGVKIEALLDKYASSAASEPMTEASFAEYLDKVENAFEESEDGRVNYKVTTNSVIDTLIEKIPEEIGAKGIEVEVEVKVVDVPNYA